MCAVIFRISNKRRQSIQ